LLFIGQAAAVQPLMGALNRIFGRPLQLSPWRTGRSHFARRIREHDRRRLDWVITARRRFEELRTFWHGGRVAANGLGGRWLRLRFLPRVLPWTKRRNERAIFADRQPVP